MKVSWSVEAHSGSCRRDGQPSGEPLPPLRAAWWRRSLTHRRSSSCRLYMRERNEINQSSRNLRYVRIPFSSRHKDLTWVSSDRSYVLVEGHLVSVRLMQLDSPGTMPIEFCPLSPGARARIRKGLINTWGVRDRPILPLPRRLT